MGEEKEEMKRRLLLIGLFVSLGLAGYGSTFSTGEQPPGFPLSELLTIPKGLGVNVPGRDAGYVTTANEAGLKFIRMDFSWSTVEEQKGVYNLAIYDAQVEEAANLNVGIMYILDYQNGLYCSDKSCQTDAERDAFANFASAAAARYAGKQILWEIWNEPNGNFWSPQPSDEAYTKLVAVTAPRIKAADPTAIVLGPSMSRFSGQWEWLENCFKRGLLNWIDAVTVHPYRNSAPETVISDYEKTRNLIREYAPEGKKDMPIISGEWGYSIYPEGEPRISEEQQAQYLARMFLVNIYQGVPLSIWYCIYNGPDPDGPDPRERNFGLIKWDGTKKPDYFAAQTICQKLAGYSYTERLNVGRADDYVLKLRKGQDEALAMWTVGVQHNATLPIGAGNGTLIQMLGSESTISWGSSGLTLSISQSPQYLLATYPNNAQCISQSVPTSVTPGSNFSVSITMKNIGTKTWTPTTHYLGSQNPQDNTTWGIGRISLPNNVSPGSEVTFSFTVTAPTTPGTYNFQWRMFEEAVEWFGDFTPNVAITVGTGTTSANNAHYISQTVPTSLTAGSQCAVSITMTNTGTKTWSTSHRLGSQNPQDNTTWGIGRVLLLNNVSPGSEVTFSFTVTAPTTPGTYNFQWRMLEEMVEWFGDFTPNVAITVEPGTPGVLTPELANVGHGFFCVAKHEGTGEMWAGTFGDQGDGKSARLYVKRNGTWQLHSDFSSYAESIYRLIYHPGTNKLYANMEVWTKNPSIFRLDGDTWVSTGYGHQYAESSKTMGIGMGLGADGYIYATTMPIAELNKGYIWRSLDGVNWSSFPDPGVGNVIAHYYAFNGQTYAVTSFGGGSKKLLRLNGATQTWETLYSNANLILEYLIEFEGALYMTGEDTSNDKAVIYRWNGTSCQPVYAAGTGTTEAFFQQMAKVKDASNTEWLYAGYSVGWRLHGDSSVHRSNDGTTWSVYQTFPGEGECWAVGTGETDYTLYVGTKNQGGGGRMYAAVYTMKVCTPVFDPGGGGYLVPQNVTITCETQGAVIHYTTNGLDPTESDPVVSGPVLVDRSMTLKARAYKTDVTPSSVASAVYTLEVEMPTFSPEGGVYSSPQSITISCTTPDAVIHYTTDGSVPDESSPAYSCPIEIENDWVTLCAKAFIQGLPSDLSCAEYLVLASIAQANKRKDGESVLLSGVITAIFPGVIYLESPGRSSGIAVHGEDSTFSTGMTAGVIGTMGTDDRGERFIESEGMGDLTDALGQWLVKPVCVRNAAIGGASWQYDAETGAGQQGVSGGSGLNNIGLLVTVWGRVTQVGDDYLYINDGSALKDGTLTGAEENLGVRVICDPSDYNTGDYLIVTGISSCFETPSGLARRILTRRPEDVRPVSPP